jgi:phosphotransferase system HPr (HPr) family protein
MSASVQRTISVVHRQGLHARPAALFVQTAKGFHSRITVKKGRKIVDGKSIMGLLTLAAHAGSRIVVLADGPDAAQALEQLCRIVTEPLPESGEFTDRR